MRLDQRRAVVLCRVSTPDQVLGLAAQREACQAYAAAHGLTVVAVHDEVIFGGTPFLDRHVLQAAIADMTVRDAGTLLAAKWDRLTRDPVTGVMLEHEVKRHGGQVVAADGAGNGDDPAAELLRGMLLLFAQFERRMIGVRTKAAMAVKRERGELIGRPHRGYTSVGGKEILKSVAAGRS